MKILFASVIFALYTLQAQGEEKFATCARKWVKIGCFKDKIKPSRPLPEMLLNDRDTNSKYHEKGYRLSWHKWKESTHSLACRCAERALAKGYTVFGLQFYGECWSGQHAHINFNRDGVASDDKCIMTLTDPMKCDDSSDQECVGAQKTNYIYKLMENPGPQTPDVDGNWTSWSEWSECSKTCGGGEKIRERACTNPEPKGNGRPCEGEPEESAKCNEQDCDVTSTPAPSVTPPPPTTEANNCNKVMDIGVIVDSSSSVKRENFNTHVKDFLKKLVDKIHVSHRMTHLGLIQYNNWPYLKWDFSSDKAQNAAALKKAIDDMEYRPGGTRTDRAFESASGILFQESHGLRPNVPHTLMVITDGRTSKKSTKYPVVLKPFKDANVTVIAIGVGPLVDNKELKQIADGKQKNVVHVKNGFKGLLERIQDIIKISCTARKLVK